MARKKWPYILGTMALIGAGWLIGRKVMKMRKQARDMENAEPIQ